MAVAVHLDGMDGVWRQRNGRQEEGTVLTDVHHARTLPYLERAPQCPHDLEAHLCPPVAIPAHIPRTPSDYDRPRSMCARAASKRLPPASWPGILVAKPAPAIAIPSRAAARATVPRRRCTADAAAAAVVCGSTATISRTGKASAKSFERRERRTSATNLAAALSSPLI